LVTKSYSKVLDQPLLRYQKQRKRLLRLLSRKRSIRYIAVGVNVLLLGAVLFIVTGSAKSQVASQSTSTTEATGTTSVNPLDQLSSADIAVSIANMAHLPEATAVKDQAETVSAEMAVSPAEDVVIAKPQVVATALKNRDDITIYTTVAGDTLSSVAAKFGVTSNSILWSNNLTSSVLPADLTLTIPPINGIVYRVKAGDTPQSLAATYSSNATQIIAYNNAEVSGLQVGEQIIIPNGQMPAPVASYNFYPSYGANGYDFGYCTWYVATQVSVPSNWGNASSWAYYASLSGWNVSTTPTVGAIAQTAYAAGGEGHVGIVAAVNGDEIEVKDMNDYGDGGGFDRVGEGWESISAYQHFITK